MTRGDTPAAPPAPGRRLHLDWLRGIAVLIMIAAHTADAWTSASGRASAIHRWTLIAGGLGAPLFLFLAGLTVSLAGDARVRRGLTPRQAAARTIRHGAVVYGLALLLQLQSWIVSGGSLVGKMLRVEILHVMGLSLVAAAVLWALGRTRLRRALWLAASAAAIAMLTPVVREAAAVRVLPDAVQWYLIPVAGRSTFTLLPSMAFLLAGAAVGELLAGRAGSADIRSHRLVLFGGAALAAGGYAASLLPPLYPRTSFWTSSPTFFFIRLGLILLMLGAASHWSRRVARPDSPIVALGLSSLFVYWIHLELVFGRPAAVLRERLDQPWPLVVFALFSLLLYAAVRLKQAAAGWWRASAPPALAAPKV